MAKITYSELQHLGQGFYVGWLHLDRDSGVRRLAIWHRRKEERYPPKSSALPEFTVYKVMAQTPLFTLDSLQPKYGMLAPEFYWIPLTHPQIPDEIRIAGEQFLKNLIQANTL